MKRRSFFEKLAYSITGITAATFSQYFPSSVIESVADETAQSNKETGGRPNFLVIVSDDTGFADVGYHDSVIRTPNIDRLALEGVELDQFYVYPMCSPTRAAFLTGRPPSRFNILSAIGQFQPSPIKPGTVMLSEMLRRAGYETCISGKWHLGMRPEEGPNHFGFDHSYGYQGPWIDSYSHLLTAKEDKRGVRQWHRNGELIDETGHVTDLITNEAIRFIREIRDSSKPFFLYVPYSSPHTPVQEPNKYTFLYKNYIENVSRQYYAAAMTHMDDCIGQILSVLEEEQLNEKTLVIYFSDNGGASGGDYSGWLTAPAEFNMSYGSTDVLADNSPLRGWKGSVYEGGIRVPALINWPGNLNSKKINNPMCVYDLVPTLAHLAGTEVPAEMNAEGTNIWPAVSGNSTPGDRIFYWRTSKMLAVRKGDWKLVHSGKTPDSGTDELFNISNDPYEEHDLASENPDIVNELKNELIQQFSWDTMPTDVQEKQSKEQNIPSKFTLKQNYPNPFNPTTTIEFSLPKADFVNLVVYSIAGQNIRELISRNLPAGIHMVEWNGCDKTGNQVSSGIYIAQLKLGNSITASRMTLVR